MSADDERAPICPACGVTMLLDAETDTWVCAECGFPEVEED